MILLLFDPTCFGLNGPSSGTRYIKIILHRARQKTAQLCKYKRRFFLSTG